MYLTLVEKRYKVKTMNLRLVEFPGNIEFSHPQPLKITTDQNKVLIAIDNFAENTPAYNVGKYNLKKVLPELKTNSAVLLIFASNIKSV
ncbi:MAG: DUF3122 domain-containing protein [Microcoleaceae cyanobacterium]